MNYCLFQRSNCCAQAIVEDIGRSPKCFFSDSLQVLVCGENSQFPIHLKILKINAGYVAVQQFAFKIFKTKTYSHSKLNLENETSQTTFRYDVFCCKTLSRTIFVQKLSKSWHHTPFWRFQCDWRIWKCYRKENFCKRSELKRWVCFSKWLFLTLLLWLRNILWVCTRSLRDVKFNGDE